MQLTTLNEIFDKGADKKKLEKEEKELLEKLELLIIERMSDEHLTVLEIANSLAVNERQVYRLVKKVTGNSPMEYVHEIRMTFAEYLFKKGKVKNVTEGAKSVGQKNVTLFNKQFEKRFGMNPKELIK